jgi:hypothetical protein
VRSARDPLLAHSPRHGPLLSFGARRKRLSRR